MARFNPLLLLALVLSLFLSSCGMFLDGACEFYSQYSSSSVYGCYDEPEDSCDITADVYDAAHFHPDVSCADIGYDVPSPYSYFYATADGSQPSPGGYFGNGGGGGGGSVGGGSSGSGKCTASYAGPEFDIQVDSFCKAAWNYLCNANDANAAEANCQIYRQWQSDNPGIPSCPYC